MGDSAGDAEGMNTIRFYTDNKGRSRFKEWLAAIRDHRAAAAIQRRIQRMRQDNFGDCKPLRDGVHEMRIDVGPGYRVYYAKAGSTVVLLLCGGDKRTQQADIDRACKYWTAWRKQNTQESES